MGLGIVDFLLRIGQKPYMAPAVRLAERAVQEFQANRHMLVRSTYTRPDGSLRNPGQHLALVTGYFSNDLGRATFGDTEAMRAVLTWLDEMGIPYDIAGTTSNGIDGVDLQRIDASRYTIVIFVCGPWLERSNALLDRFPQAFKVGVNLSIEVGTSHRFDLLLPRDFAGQSMPDLVFARQTVHKPLVGIALAHRQFEYGARQRHEEVGRAVADFAASEAIAVMPLDTLHLDNAIGLTSAVQYENLVRRLDVVVTTRLHGMVFSIKNGVPVVAIDAIAGGAKVTRQAAALEWPMLLPAEQATSDSIARAVDRCLSGEFSEALARSAVRASHAAASTRDRFVSALRSVPTPPAR